MQNFGGLSIAIGIVGAFIMASCNQSHQQYTPPKILADGWQVSSPAKEGLDEALLVQAIEKNKQDGNVDGFIIVRRGKLVVDEYFNDYSTKKTHKVWSITKAVTSALTGIAIEKGFIKSENDSINRYIGTYAAQLPADKNSITISHLLSMTSGINWVELGGPNSAGYKVAYSPDWIEFVLGQPMGNTPGTTFNYCTGNYMLLAPIIKNATGEQADKFAAKYLFSPLGITNYEWVKCSEFWSKTEDGELPSAKKPEPPISYSPTFAEYPSAGSGLKMLPRDMARLGQLYLDKGKWRGQQLISESWIARPTQSSAGNSGYGYGWWLDDFDVNNTKVSCFHASGFGLQSIYVFPAFDMVVVFTQQNYRTMQQGEERTQDVLKNYVLKAVKK